MFYLRSFILPNEGDKVIYHAKINVGLNFLNL